MSLYDPASFSSEPGWTPLDLYFPDRHAPWLKVGLVTASEPAVTLETYIDLASSEALELLVRDALPTLCRRSGRSASWVQG